MQIGSVSSIAMSGLRLESKRLAQSANNVANVETDNFEAQRVFGESQAAGGVTSYSAPTYAPHTLQSADDGSSSYASNTDLADERVTQLSSLRSFQANIATLRTSDEMLGELVNLKA